jgi:hypothetical protein
MSRLTEQTTPEQTRRASLLRRRLRFRGWSHFAPIADHWRVLVAIAAVGVLGEILGRLLLPWFDPWTNGWIGGGLVAPAGFLGGLWWQLASPRRRHKTRLDVLLLLAVLACGAAPVSALDEMRSERDFQARLDTFRTLPASSIRQITCYDKYGGEELLTIEDPDVLRAFAVACRDAKGYSPNHPRYFESWYIVVTFDAVPDPNRSPGSKPNDTPAADRPVGRDLHGRNGPDHPLELECHFEQGRGTQLVGYFVRKRGSVTGYSGSFISTDLRPWFERHIYRGETAQR